MSYVYVRSEGSLWTVGFYDPRGKWHADQDFDSPQEAARRVAYLNGSGSREWLNQALNEGDGTYKP